MGHRALVAYERIDGDYNLHYSHWGGCDLRLKHTITEATPFGNDRPSQWAHDAYDALVAGEEPSEVAYRLELNTQDGDVEPTPRETAVSLETALADHLDFLQHEAFYVVDCDLEVTAYRPLWFGLCYDAESIAESAFVGNGAVRRVRWYDGEPVGDGYTRGEFAGLKDVVGDMVDRGVFGRAAALAYLERKVRENACPHTEMRFVQTATPDAQ